MDVGKEYTAVVIPPGFTASLLAVAGVSGGSTRPAVKPTVELLTNPRAGTLAVSLATGALQPALAQASGREDAEAASDAPAGRLGDGQT